MGGSSTVCSARRECKRVLSCGREVAVLRHTRQYAVAVQDLSPRDLKLDLASISPRSRLGGLWLCLGQRIARRASEWMAELSSWRDCSHAQRLLGCDQQRPTHAEPPSTAIELYRICRFEIARLQLVLLPAYRLQWLVLSALLAVGRCALAPHRESQSASVVQCAL